MLLIYIDQINDQMFPEFQKPTYTKVFILQNLMEINFNMDI